MLAAGGCYQFYLGCRRDTGLPPSPSFHPGEAGAPDSHHTSATLQTLLQAGSSEQQPSTQPQLSSLLSHPSSMLLRYRGVCATGKLLPPSCGRGQRASAPRRYQEAIQGRAEAEGEEQGGEDSLGTQCQLPVVGAHPLARPAAKNRLSHGTRLGRRGTDHTCKKQTSAVSIAATPPSRKHRAALGTALLTIPKGHSTGKQNRGDLPASHTVEGD